MITFSSAPAFLFAYVARMPRSNAELSRIQALRRQQTALIRFSRQNHVAIGKRFIAVTTYRRKSFLDTPQFANALSEARERGAPLLVADIRDLIMRLQPDLVPGCLNRLDELDVELFDVGTQKCWDRSDSAIRLGIVAAAAAHRNTRVAISLGRTQSDPGSLNIRSNQLAGADANRRKAKQRAEQFRAIVAELEARLPEGKVLAPSVLMHRLNEIGIKPPKADQWSLNGAKRILQRIRDGSASPT